MNDFLKNAVDFNCMLLDKYKKIGLSEVEVTTVLVMNQLIEQGNHFITADLLSLKMNLSLKEIDNILVTLLNRKFIEYETTKKQMRTTLKPLKDRLLRELTFDLSTNQTIEVKKANDNNFAKIKDTFEKSLGRNLTPLEVDKVKEWIACGYKEDVIICALDEAIAQNKKTIRTVDKILIKKGVRNDMVKEGYSTISETWKKDISETIDIAKKEWNK